VFDCHKDVLAFHNDEVRLPKSEQKNMRERRDANRKRLKDGLEKNKNPQPIEFHKQGSYAMKTMVQHPDNAYDVDDGVYFDKEDLKGKNGGDKAAIDARNMVRDAVDDGSFKTAPEVRTNCVRVFYEAGYHVDLPVYRRVVTKAWDGSESVHHELASSDWKRSDARDVTKWFEGENDRLSPDDNDGKQMRRMCREIKKFAQSRSSWSGRIASGFMITKLVTECYCQNAVREDQALHDTMKAIRDRLDRDLIVSHPVTPNETITKGEADPKAKFLKERLSEALTNLEPLHSSNCTRDEALKAWDKVFNTDFFSKRGEQSAKATDAVRESATEGAAVGNAAIVRGWAKSSEPSPVEKRGSGTYA
jgi:hypothetical protein